MRCVLPPAPRDTRSVSQDNILQTKRASANSAEDHRLAVGGQAMVNVDRSGRRHPTQDPASLITLPLTSSLNRPAVHQTEACPAVV